MPNQTVRIKVAGLGAARRVAKAMREAAKAANRDLIRGEDPYQVQVRVGGDWIPVAAFKASKGTLQARLSSTARHDTAAVYSLGSKGAVFQVLLPAPSPRSHLSKIRTQATKWSSRFGAGETTFTIYLSQY